MALPGMPLGVLCALLVPVVLLGAPHSAAQGALLPEVLGERFEQGLAVRQITSQAAQLAGFGLGGVLLTAVPPGVALAADALTFLASAALVRIGVRDRPAPGRDATPDTAGLRGAVESGGANGANGTAPSGGARGVERGGVGGAITPGGAGRAGGADGVGGASAPAGAVGANGSIAPGGVARRWWADTRAGVVAVSADPRRRVLASLVWLVGCYVVPEGLAAPYAAQLGAGPLAVGLLMAADPAGGVLGAWLVTRFVPEWWRSRLLGGFAAGGGLALAACWAGPGVLVSALLWGASGVCSSACLVQAQTAFVRATPDELRGRAIGVAASGLIAAQGVAILVAGLLAERVGAAAAIGGTGLLGLLLAVGLAVGWRRAAVGHPDLGADGVPLARGR
jgi:hypothetical protein